MSFSLSSIYSVVHYAINGAGAASSNNTFFHSNITENRKTFIDIKHERKCLRLIRKYPHLRNIYPINKLDFERFNANSAEQAEQELFKICKEDLAKGLDPFHSKVTKEMLSVNAINQEILSALPSVAGLPPLVPGIPPGTVLALERLSPVFSRAISRTMPGHITPISKELDAILSSYQSAKRQNILTNEEMDNDILSIRLLIHKRFKDCKWLDECKKTKKTEFQKDFSCCSTLESKLTRDMKLIENEVLFRKCERLIQLYQDQE